jgi:predicted ATP-binding protein involved in virulence
MQITQTTINNFRGKENLNIQLGSRVTLLVGENGSGKTTILDAIAIGLGAILSHLPKVTGITFKNSDLMQDNEKKAPYTRIKLKATNDIEWDRTLRRDQSKQTLSNIPSAVGLTSLKNYIDKNIINPFNEDLDFSLPVYSYYGVSRALLDVPLRRRGFPKNHKRFEALENSLNSTSRFKSAFVWFYNKENEEQRKQKELRSFDYKLPQLEAVRQAIETVFPDISEAHIMLNPLRFAVKINGETLDIMQLSDGYKTLLSLIIDLASRMALANPHLQNPLETFSTVLIDEVDLHLHPEWQRRVISDLLRVFPKTQFILTTHSPYIIESVNNNLMRHHIHKTYFTDKTIEDIYPLAPEAAACYYTSSSGLIDLMDKELNLIDDRLIRPFNSISELYERMRDIQWSSLKS